MFTLFPFRELLARFFPHSLLKAFVLGSGAVEPRVEYFTRRLLPTPPSPLIDTPQCSAAALRQRSRAAEPDHFRTRR